MKKERKSKEEPDSWKNPEKLEGEELESFYRKALDKFEELNRAAEPKDNNERIDHLNQAFRHAASHHVSKKQAGSVGDKSSTLGSQISLWHLQCASFRSVCVCLLMRSE